jgi:hypothetical protein
MLTFNNIVTSKDLKVLLDNCYENNDLELEDFDIIENILSARYINVSDFRKYTVGFPEYFDDESFNDWLVSSLELSISLDLVKVLEKDHLDLVDAYEFERRISSPISPESFLSHLGHENPTAFIIESGLQLEFNKEVFPERNSLKGMLHNLTRALSA